MKALAAFMMQGRPQAATAIGGLSALGLVIPPVGILGSGGLALIALRLGVGQALTVMLAVAVLLGVLTFLVAGTVMPVAVLMAVQWLPVVGLALVLRATASWGMTLQTGLVVAGLLVLAVRFSVPDIEAQWAEFLRTTFGPMFDEAGMSAEDVGGLIDTLAPSMTGIATAGTLFGLLLALMLGRHWQALLYNPGGFGAEFRVLDLGRLAAVAFVALLTVAWFGEVTLAGELAAVLAVAFLLQGLAVAHAFSHARGLAQFWLVGMYVLLVLAMPQLATMLIALGAIDALAGLRQRFGGPPPQAE